MNPERLLARPRRGDSANVAFADLFGLLEALGFEKQRVSGSHHVYGHPQLVELINLQEVKGQAKPYQVRQVLRLIERYDLAMEGEK